MIKTIAIRMPAGFARHQQLIFIVIFIRFTAFHIRHRKAYTQLCVFNFIMAKWVDKNSIFFFFSALRSVHSKLVYVNRGLWSRCVCLWMSVPICQQCDRREKKKKMTPFYLPIGKMFYCFTFMKFVNEIVDMLNVVSHGKLNGFVIVCEHE